APAAAGARESAGAGAPRGPTRAGCSSYAMSNRQGQPVVAAGEAGPDAGRAPGRLLAQNRVGVVVIRIDAMPARQRRELLETPPRAADRQVVQLARGPAANAHRNELIVLPERAVEQEDISLRQARAHRGREISATRHERTDRPAIPYTEKQPHRVS